MRREKEIRSAFGDESMRSGREESLAVASCFHCVVGQGLRFGKGLINGLLTSVGSREFLADFGRDTRKFRDGNELDTNIRHGFNRWVCWIGRKDRI